METNKTIQVKPVRTLKDVGQILAHSSGLMKSVCGVTNNYAILVMLDAHDQIKNTDIYRHEVKRAFRQAISEMQSYRKKLRLGCSGGLRYFNINDMLPEIRPKYGDITSSDYFEYWESLGSLAYTKVKDLANSLCYKYEKVLIANGCKYHKEFGLVMVASVALSVAASQYQEVIRQCCETLHVTAAELDEMLSPFNMNSVNLRWKRAWELADPYCSMESNRNTDLGIEQLSDALRDPLLIFDSVIDSAEAYEEIFACKKIQKGVVKGLKSERREFLKV